MSHFSIGAFLKSFLVKDVAEGWNDLILAGGDARKRVKPIPFTSQRRNVVCMDVDTVPHTVFRIADRHAEFLRNARSFDGFYNSLASMISEENVREFYPDLWLQHRNYLVRKRNLIEWEEMRHRQKSGEGGGQDYTGREVGGYFREMRSARNFARSSIV